MEHYSWRLRAYLNITYSAHESPYDGISPVNLACPSSSLARDPWEPKLDENSRKILFPSSSRETETAKQKCLRQALYVVYYIKT